MGKPKYWFCAKTYGWGWYPCSWQGWTLLITSFLAIAYVAFVSNKYAQSERDFVTVFTLFVVIITSLIVYMSYKTGEPPRWRWGKL